MTTEQQTRLIFEELEQLHASDAKLRWTAAERIAAKLGEGEKGVEKSKAEIEAEKFVRVVCDGRTRSYLAFGEGCVGGFQLPSNAEGDCAIIRTRLASLLTSFGTERAAEAVAAERGRIAGEMRRMNPIGGTGFASVSIGVVLGIVEGVGK